MSRQRTASESSRSGNGRETPAWGWLLTLWMALVVILHGVIWTTGVPDHDLARAVEAGAAQVEQQQLGEENEDVVRKAIQMQRDTLLFWTVIAAIRDFLVAPMVLGLRAFAVAVALSAVAAATGRPVRFPEAMVGCVAWQGVWVLGLAVRVVLMLLLRQSSASTSILLFLSQESFSASQWTLLQQIDCFGVIGWLGLVWGAWRRGQAHWLVAAVVCFMLAAAEVSVCSSASLMVNLSMRATLMPQ